MGSAGGDGTNAGEGIEAGDPAAAMPADNTKQKSARKAGRKADRKEAKPSKKARKALQLAIKAVAKIERKAAKARRKARTGGAAMAADGMLREVAGLVRQASEPAAARIAQRLADLAVSDVAVEPEPEPEPEPVAVEPEPDPEPVAVEPEPDPEPGEPEPEPVAVEPEPEPEPDPEPTTPAIVVPPGAVVGASIDIGSTSVHLLVAAVGDHVVDPLLDESVFLGLGDRVSADGYLGAAARSELVDALAAYVETARSLGAGDVTLIGTEPLRRAEDGAALVQAVEAKTGLPLHVLDHDEEGMLTLLGVTRGQALHAELLVVDIGGGSTEFILAGESGPVRVAGLRLGASRLTRELVRSDPPTLAETEALRAAAKLLVAEAPQASPIDVVAVGGTASNLVKLLPTTAMDRVLTRRRITVALAMLTVERSTDAASRHLIRPERARILPAGAVIMDAILAHYGVDRLRVAEEGMREGAILAVARAGAAWRDRLPVLVHGWEAEPRGEG